MLRARFSYFGVAPPSDGTHRLLPWIRMPSSEMFD